MKILYLAALNPLYLQDQLFDGLMKEGHEVMVFPPKPNYCDKSNDVHHYSYPRQYTSYEDVVRSCRKNRFDIAVLTSVTGLDPIKTLYKSIIGNEVKCPIVLLNETPLYAPKTEYEYILSGKMPIAEFWCERYVRLGDGIRGDSVCDEKDVIPLLYSFRSEFLQKKEVDMNSKRFDVFFSCRSASTEANKRRFEAAMTIQGKFPNSLVAYENPILPYNHYLECIRKSWIGLSFAGHFWSPRYWEVVGCQAGLVSDDMRKEIVIPNNFEDKIHARFFTKLDEMVEIIVELLEDKEKLLDMTKRAHQHLINYHLTTHRAKTFIKEIEKRL